MMPRIPVRGTPATSFTWARIRGRWSDADPVTGDGSRGTGRGEAVILTGDGRARWVLEAWSDWEGEACRYRAMTPGAARDWLEGAGFAAAVTEHFGGSRREAADDLRAYREAVARRDEVIRAAHSAGMDVSEIAGLSGVSRPTVYRVLGLEGDGTERPSPQGAAGDVGAAGPAGAGRNGGSAGVAPPAPFASTTSAMSAS